MTTELTPNDGAPEPNETPTTSQPTAGYRSAVTKRPDARLDGNSAVGRRVRDLYQALMTRLENPTDVLVQADILAWAELKAAAETARAALLEGDSKSSNEVVRLENLTRRAAGTVGLEPAAGASEQDSNAYRFGGLFIDDDEEPAS